MTDGVPSILNPLIIAAANHQKNGRFSQAVECYRQIAAIMPDWADLHNNLGCALEAQGNLDVAANSYRRAIALDPNNATAHHNLGCVLNMKGKFDEAAVGYRRAIDLKPDHADACNNLAHILFDRGNLDEAAEYYRRVTTLKPDSAEARNNLGCILLDRGNLVEATACFEEAIRLQPDYAEAHCNLGVALKEQGKLDQAMQCHARALAINPDYAKACNNMASVLKMQARLEEAMAYCDRALSLKPDFAEAHCNRANVFLDQGDLTQAEKICRLAITLKPGYPEAYYNLSQMKTFREGDADLGNLEALSAESVRLPAAKRPYIHFAFAKALEDVGDYPGSFEQLAKGNRLKRQLVAYDEMGTKESFRQIAEVFDGRRMNRYGGTGDASATPIFVLGMPRSGSTLIEQILSNHPLIHGAGELPLLSVVANSLRDHTGRSLSYPHSFSSVDAATLRSLGETYLRSLPKPPVGKLRIVDKMPGNFAYVGLIHLFLPNARIIHTMRNPADTCFSCYSKLFTHGMEFSYDLGELGRYHMCYESMMNHWRSVLPPDAMLDVSYEQVVDDLERQARRLIDFCGLPWDSACLSFHENKRPVSTASNVQARRPIYRSSVNRWQRYEAFLGPLLDELQF